MRVFRLPSRRRWDLHSSEVFFLRFIAQQISEIHRVTKLQNCSFNPLNAELNSICHLLELLEAHHIFHVSVLRVNQFALVVPRRASDKECIVLGSYEYSSEKQVQRKNTAALLWYYAAYRGDSLPTFRGSLSIPSSRVKKLKSSIFFQLEDGTSKSSRNVSKEFLSTLLYTPEKCRSQGFYRLQFVLRPTQGLEVFVRCLCTRLCFVRGISRYRQACFASWLSRRE